MFFFFFPPGNPLQTAKCVLSLNFHSWCRISRSACQTGLLLSLHGHQTKQNCKPNPPHFVQSQSCSSVAEGTLHNNTAATGGAGLSAGPVSIQPGQTFSWVLIDAGGPTGLLEHSYTKCSFHCCWSNFRFSHMEEKYRTLYNFFIAFQSRQIVKEVWIILLDWQNRYRKHKF